MGLFGFGKKKHERNDRMVGGHETAGTSEETEKEAQSAGDSGRADAETSGRADAVPAEGGSEAPGDAEAERRLRVEEDFAQNAPDKDDENAPFFREVLMSEKLYLIHSRATKLPYVEYSRETEENRAYLFTEAEDAENCCKVLELTQNQTVAVPVGRSRYPGVLGSFYLLGIDTVVVNRKGTVVTSPLEKIARRRDPEDLPKEKRPVENPALQLSMMYFMQEFRKKVEKPDQKKRAELDRAVLMNLLPARYLLPVREQERDGKKEFGMLVLKNSKTDSMLVPLFTDLPEFLRFRGNAQDTSLKLLPTDFTHLAGMKLPAGAEGFLVNPASVSLRLPQGFMKHVLSQIAEQQNQKKTEPGETDGVSGENA